MEEEGWIHQLRKESADKPRRRKHTDTHGAGERKQDGSPRRERSGRQRGAKACTY